MKVTIKDVAKACNLSVTQVSRALNGHYDVNELTRQKVIDVARELNYFPNKYAQKLASKTNNQIDVILVNFVQEHTPELIMEKLQGMFDECDSQDLLLNFHYLTPKAIKKYSLKEYISANNMLRPIIIGLEPGIEQEILADDFLLDIVIIDNYFDKPNVCAINNDDAYGSQLVMAYFQEHQVKNILCITGGERGYVTEMRKHGVNTTDFNVDFYDGQYDRQRSYEITASLDLTQYEAIYCFSDIMALGVRDVLLEKNLDIMLVGYDGLGIIAMLQPKIISVKQQEYEKGVMSIKKSRNFRAGNYLIMPHLVNT